MRAREKASYVDVPVEIATASLPDRLASRTCRAWRSRRRFCVRSTLGRDHETTVGLEGALLEAIHQDNSSSLDELRKAISHAADGCRRARRVYGDEHPLAMQLAGDLNDAREALARRTPPP